MGAWPRADHSARRILRHLCTVAVWETAAPRRARLLPRRVRWFHNLALVVLNSLILRLLFPLAAVGFAVLTAERGWGLLNAFEVPFWSAFALSVIALDYAIYLQHVMFHAVPLLWRLHRVHHADADIDVTTGARFHPIEVLHLDADQVRGDRGARGAGGC